MAEETVVEKAPEGRAHLGLIEMRRKNGWIDAMSLTLFTLSQALREVYHGSTCTHCSSTKGFATIVLICS